GHIHFTMGTTSKGPGGIPSSKHGTAFSLHRNKGHVSPSSNERKSSDFPAFPKSAADAASGRSGGHSGVPYPSNVRPGVVYADDKPADSTRSNEKPSDSSFFDATRSSENEDSGFELIKPDSKDKPSLDSESFFDEDKSSEHDHSRFESMNPDSKDKSSSDSDSFFDEDRSSEHDHSRFESMNPDSKDKSSSDSDSFFDEDKSSEHDHSRSESMNPDSKDKSYSDSDSFFDEDKSSEHDHSRSESMNPDSKDKSSFDSESFFDEDKSSEDDHSRFERVKPSFHSDKSAESDDSGFDFEKSSHSDDKSTGSSSRFHNEKRDAENQKREFSGRSGVKSPFSGTSKFPLSSDRPFLAGTPKIKFVMGREASGRFSSRGPLKSGPLRKRVFRDGPTRFHSPYTLRDRVFYLSGAGDVPAYDFSSVYGPPASLLYDGGDVPLFLDGAGPEEDVFAFEKK
ncbi:hypothetical protein AVEN_51493-1, partial [Araneus ventricosus]